MKIIEVFATKNECFLASHPLRPKGIVLHSVGFPQDKAEVFARHFNQWRPDGVQKCVHAFVQADGMVYQTLPWEVRGWHAGGAANGTHIGVEMMEPKSIKYTSAFGWADLNPQKTLSYVLDIYECAVELCAMLCAQYCLDPIADGVLISHSEAHARGLASKHRDPEHIWERLEVRGMDGFRTAVGAMLGVAERSEVAQ